MASKKAPKKPASATATATNPATQKPAAKKPVPKNSAPFTLRPKRAYVLPHLPAALGVDPLFAIVLHSMAFLELSGIDAGASLFQGLDSRET